MHGNGPAVIQKNLINIHRKKKIEARASRPSQRYRRGLHSLKVGIDLPYNLHTLQLATMQEKTLVLAVNL